MRRKIGLFFALAFCLQAVPASFSAEEINVPNAYEAESGIQPYASDVIVYKYRMYNGRWQYRRWNETRACWVDHMWIYV